MNMLILVLGIVLGIGQTISKCAFTQHCNDAITGDCDIPRKVHANETEPKVLPAGLLCPEFQNSPVCCNAAQNIVLNSNLNSLDLIFGGDGGCEVCAINLKRFWCYFTCSPNQSDFIAPGKTEKTKIDGKYHTLLHLNMTLNSKMNCDLFKSCRKTKYASEVTAMGNAIGFTSFQGAQAYMKSPVYINMLYAEKGGLKLDLAPCNLPVPKNHTLFGFPLNEKCTCNSCAEACSYAPLKNIYGVFEGFHYWIVGIVYLVVAVFTLAIYFIKKKCKSKYGDEDSLSAGSSINLENPDNRKITVDNTVVPQI